MAYTYKVVLALLSIYITFASGWKKCEQVPFCKRLRHNIPHDVYSLVPLTITENTIQGNLSKNGDQSTSALLTITSLENGIFRLFVDDAIPQQRRRYSVQHTLVSAPILTTTGTSEKHHNTITLINGKYEAIIYLNPFKVEVYTDKQLGVVVNSKQRLVFEQSIALDFNFPAAQTAYGLPLHADHLALRTTKNEDPYRLFNADYYAYRPNSTEALYGSIPVLYAHGTTHTSGIFWLNSAQTWADLDVSTKHVEAYLMSETGTIDTFILPGPTLPDTIKQYTKLTGTAPLPQYFALGYHQSRYSYMSEDEVKEVAEQFKRNNMPLDVLWLDIDYTVGKKYFTWNPVTFSDPVGLQNYLLDDGKELVVIIDPHIKNETGYFVHDEAVKNGYYIRNPNGSNYVGKCWPGPSSYLDLTNPKALNYYASLYETNDSFQSKGIHIWNDMNEPSVFYTEFSEEQEYEKTIPLDRLHYDNYEHRDVHNIYGHLQAMATNKGMLARPNNTVRPFVLTRSHFAGTQRYAAIWTGDVFASWEHLQISIPMCLAEALAGISFCGSDVGGFTGIPSDELYQRWYQVGAWLAFYRGHSAMEVPRREPYRFSDEVKRRISKSLNQRYSHLPVWYTLFYEHERTGEPVIRPMSYHYTTEVVTFGIDDQFLVGSDILVAPVLTEAATTSQIYLPGGVNEIWYNIDDHFSLHRGIGYQNFEVNLDSVPVFYRGGGIIVRKDTPRLSTVETYNDPFTVYVVPDIQGSAKGNIYVDDYESFEYKNSAQYLYSELEFSNNRLVLRIEDIPRYTKVPNVSKIIILNSPNAYSQAVQKSSDVQLSVYYDKDSKITTILNCTLKLYIPFEILLH